MRRLLVVTVASVVAACTSSQQAPVVSARVRPAAVAAAAPAPTQAFADTAPELVFVNPSRRAKLEASFSAVDEAAEEELRAQELPGLVVGIVVDGELAHVRGFGVTDRERKTPPDADTVFRIGSITKSFTGFVTLALRDDGALSLDDPLVRFVPEAAGLVYPTREAGPITLRQLLTHTSGLPRLGAFDYTSTTHDVTEAEMLGSLRGFALEHAPGTAWVYSNLGFGLLGVAAGRAAHLSYRELVRTRVLAPLGMTSTVWDASDVPKGRLATAYARGPHRASHPVAQWRLGAAEALGGLYSTTRDMARYVAFQLSAYPPRNDADRGPVRRATIREAHATGLASGLKVALEPASNRGDALVAAGATTYGNGWVAERTCDFEQLVWHNGAVDGFSADIAFLPEYGVGVVVLTNVWTALPETVAMKALRALARGGGLTRRTPPLSPDFAPAMQHYLAVQNAWDQTAYAAMLGRPEEPSEKAEIAGYKERHGACSGATLLEVISPRRARFRLACEKGPLDMELALGLGDKILGFTGTSRDQPLSAPLRRAGDRLVALVARWSALNFERLVHATSPAATRDAAAAFGALHAEHGSCHVVAATHIALDVKVRVACERGGDRFLDLKLDDADPNVVASYAFERPPSPGPCPVR